MANTFALDVAAFVKKATAAPETVVRKVSIDMAAKVINRTPVGNPSLWKGKPPAGYVGGRLRANWVVSFDSPSSETTDKTDASGSATAAYASSKINTWRGGDIFIMNSLPYVGEIEFRGHSSQAPAGMVRVTVVEFQSFVNQAVRSLPK